MNAFPTSRLDALPPLREVIAEHGLSAQRSLGQHFLLDLNLTRRIANAATRLKEGTVIEVGPGPGGLTRSLLSAGASRLLAIERDERCIKALMSLQKASDNRLFVLHEDALQFNYNKFNPGPLSLVANLPYNIATPLLINWLRMGTRITEMVLMFQAEVAERITASPGNKSFGRLSVISNWCAETQLLFRIPARSFTPPPKVDSAVVRITPKGKRMPNIELSVLESVSGAAFGQRRKTLRRSLSQLDVPTTELLLKSGVDGRRRAEELSIEEFAALAKAVSDLRANL
ncbi:MAG: 16S rRNA (adenine(1518)-N(6)/adenine(1519)-N(6))-dimethyltransferase RsmA [Candidatus Latescibacterota bacterium]